MKPLLTLLNHDGLKAVLLLATQIGLWMLLSTNSYYNESGRNLSFFIISVAFIYFFGYNSTHKIRRMRHEYKGIFDNHPSPMWIFDPLTLRFLAVNKSAIKHYGYSRDEFLSMTILQIRPEKDITAVKETLSETTRRELKESSWIHQKKNGEHIMVRIITSDVTFNKKTARLVEVQDITTAMAQQREIEKLSLVAKNASNGVIISDNTGKIEWVNDAFTKVTGFTLQEVKGKHPRTFLHGDNTDRETEKHINEMALNKRGFTGEIVNYKKDGTPYWVHLNLSPVLKEGEVKNIVVIQTDITEIRNQYEQLKHIAFMTSHEARSQLTNIMALCELMRNSPTPEEQITLAEHIDTVAHKLDEVIQTIVKRTAA